MPNSCYGCRVSVSQARACAVGAGAIPDSWLNLELATSIRAFPRLTWLVELVDGVLLVGDGSWWMVVSGR